MLRWPILQIRPLIHRREEYVHLYGAHFTNSSYLWRIYQVIKILAIGHNDIVILDAPAMGRIHAHQPMDQCYRGDPDNVRAAQWGINQVMKSVPRAG
jgi:hypothetical protein